MSSNIISIHSKQAINNYIIKEKNEKQTNIKNRINKILNKEEINKISHMNRSSSVDNLINLKFSLSRKGSNERTKSNKIITNTENITVTNFKIRSMNEFYVNINTNEKINFLNKEYFPFTFDYLKQTTLTGKTLSSKVVSLSKVYRLIYNKENMNNNEIRLSFLNENIKKLIKFYLTLIKELIYFEITSSSKVVLIGIINKENNKIEIYVNDSVINFIINHILYMKFIIGKTILDRIINLIYHIQEMNNDNEGNIENSNSNNKFYKLNLNKEYTVMNKSLIAIINSDKHKSDYKTQYFPYKHNQTSLHISSSSSSSSIQVTFEFKSNNILNLFNFKDIIRKTLLNRNQLKNELKLSNNMSIKLLLLNNDIQYKTYNINSNQIEFNIDNNLITLEKHNDFSYDLRFREPFSCLSAFSICIIRLNKFIY